MAAEAWMEIYRAYTSDELNAEIVQLKKDVRGSFSGQGHGGTSHQRDLQELRDRLQAAVRVSNEKSKGPSRGTWKVGQVDFSRNSWDAP